MNIGRHSANKVSLSHLFPCSLIFMNSLKEPRGIRCRVVGGKLGGPKREKGW